MESKLFLNSILLLPLILALNPQHVCASSFPQEKAGNATGCPPAPAPMIHITSAMHCHCNSPQVRIQIKAGPGLWATVHGPIDLRPSQKYRLRTDEVNTVYYAMALYGLKFTSFHAYEPARDKGRAAVYWRVDDWGFSVSHDKRTWKKEAPWETE